MPKLNKSQNWKISNGVTKGLLVKVALVIFCLALFSFKAGDVKLQFTGDENFYYESSRNMLETGDWVTPEYYGKKRFQKPFLFYWMVAASFKVAGVNWLAARLPSILAGVFIVLLTFLMGKELFNAPAGLISAGVLATSLKFFKYTRAVIPDMTLLLFVTLSLFLFLKGRNNPQKRKLFLSGVFVMLALATLTKGPVGLAIPFLIIWAFIILSGERNPFKDLPVGLGTLIYVLIVAPWFVIMIKLHGFEYINHVWIRELLQRVGKFSEPGSEPVTLFMYLKGLTFYIPVIAVRFLPWSIFLPFGLVSSFRLLKNEHEKNQNLMVLLWFFVVFLFFTLMGEKHSQYILMIAPPLTLIIGSFFMRMGETGKIKTAVPAAITTVLVITIITMLSFPVLKPNSAVLASFSARMLEQGMDDNARIGTGSHDLIPQKLEVYLGRTVEKIGVKQRDPVNHIKWNKDRLKAFLTDKNQVFCLIKKEDYLKFVDPRLQKRLSVIDKDFLWKRKIILGQPWKSEYWLVTNK